MAGAFTIVYSITDAKGQSSLTEFNFPSNYNLADVLLFAQQSAGRINDIITGKIDRIGIAITVPLPGGLRTTPLVNSDVEEGARFQFRTAGNFFTSMRIPTFREDLIVDNTTQVDLTDGDVTDFVNSMVTGAPVVALGGVLSPSDKRDDDIVALESAKEQFLGSRRSK